MSDSEKARFKVEKKQVVLELVDGSLLYSDQMYYFDNVEKKLNLIQ